MLGRGGAGVAVLEENALIGRIVKVWHFLKIFFGKVTDLLPIFYWVIDLIIM